MTRTTGILTTLLALLILAGSFAGCGGGISTANLSASELFALGKDHYDREKYRQAIEYFQAAVYEHPGASIVDTAQYYLALAYFSNEEYALAQVEFNRLVNYYPSSVYIVNAQFLKSVCMFEGTPGHFGLDQTSVRDAVRQFEDFLIDYPESEMVPEAQAYLAKAHSRLAKKDFQSAMTYLRMGGYKAAEIYFQKVIDEYTTTEYGAQSLFYLAEVSEKMKDYAAAATRYESFATVYPEHEWAGKAHEKAAETAFKAAERAVNDRDAAGAREQLESFLSKYPNDERAGKARAYLEQIGDIPVESDSEQQTAEP